MKLVNVLCSELAFWICFVCIFCNMNCLYVLKIYIFVDLIFGSSLSEASKCVVQLY